MTTDEMCCMDGCEKPIYAKRDRLCTTHYGRKRKYGDPRGEDAPLPPDPPKMGKKDPPKPKPKPTPVGKVEHGPKGSARYLKVFAGAEAECLCGAFYVFVPNRNKDKAVEMAEADLQFHLDKHKRATSTG